MTSKKIAILIVGLFDPRMRIVLVDVCRVGVMDAMRPLPAEVRRAERREAKMAKKVVYMFVVGKSAMSGIVACKRCESPSILFSVLAGLDKKTNLRRTAQS